MLKIYHTVTSFRVRRRRETQNGATVVESAGGHRKLVLFKMRSDRRADSFVAYMYCSYMPDALLIYCIN
jgi:hypothetical protein